jgi:hypothetical protein
MFEPGFEFAALSLFAGLSPSVPGLPHRPS